MKHLLSFRTLTATLLLWAVSTAVQAQSYTVTITAPGNGTTHPTGTAIALAATATGSPITRVRFRQNGTLIGTGDTTAPYTGSFTPGSAGTYVLTAEVVYVGNVVATSSSVTITATSGGNTPPTVSLTSPSNGATGTAPASFTLTATASDSDGTVSSVAFYANGSFLGSDASSPYTYSWTGVAAGSYSLTAVATDNASATTTSTPVAVTVNSAPTAVTATRRYVYDSYERLCKVIEPERGATIIEYDAAGNIAWTAEGTNLTSTTDCQRGSVNAGDKVTRTYDDMNRVTAVNTPGGTADVTTTYYADGAVNTLTAANPSGNTVTTTYTYNKRRLLVGESMSIVGPQSHGALALGYGYDPNGFLSTLTYPDLETVNFAPDALGRATQVITGGGTTYASGITYFAGGAIAGFNYGNGITHTMGKNLRQLPTTSQDWYCTPAPNTEACANKTYVLNDTYAFDANGNVDYVTDALPASATNRSRDLGYDALDRLIVADAANQWGTATFSYDALDNIRGADVGTRQYRYNYDAATNRLLNIKNPAGVQQFAFSYDSRGNTTSKTGQTYVFDYANRLNAVTGSQTYSYDGQGRRVLTLDADNKATYWIYSQAGQVLYTEEARRRQNLNYVYLGNTQVATRAWNWDTFASTIRYQHTDSLGSIVVQTDTSKAVVVRNSYEPYGGAYNSTIDGTGYTGHVMDQATGLTYMQQRYYDPAIGRFLSTDPMASDQDNAWNFNRYNYAANNPYKFTDPDGRLAIDDSPEHRRPEPPRPIPAPTPVPAPSVTPPAPEPAGYYLKQGVPEPSPQIDALLVCTASCSGPTPLRVTATSDSHAPTNPHTLGNAVDVTTKAPETTMKCAANCGASFQLNEYAHPSKNATGGHVHLQLVPGRGGATGPYYPDPPKAPERTNRNDKELRE